jgi:predicted O-methyltransferase YrrM
MTFPSSDNVVVDAFLARGYTRIRGMSSRFAAGICGWLIGHQTRNRIDGGVVEIGAFEGRFLFALALGLSANERAIGIDSFDWPSPAIEARFNRHAQRLGLGGRITGWKADSRRIAPADLLARLEGQPARFIHIDGEHSPEALASDLRLAVACLHPQGLICLDDMLHPAYPFLAGAVETFLRANSAWRLMAILDREDIVAAAKFLLCRADAVPLYETALMAQFPRHHFVLGGDALGHHCVVLTPKPRLARVD